MAKSLKGKIISSIVVPVNQAQNPDTDADVTIVATDGGNVIRKWQRDDGKYISQVFLPGGTIVLHTVSDQALVGGD